MIHLKHVSSIAIGILVVLFAVPAFAQTLIDAGATSAVEATVTPTPISNAKPLDAIKARANEIKRGVMKTGMQPGVEVDARVHANQGSTTVRDRIQSATLQMRLNLKESVRQHAGLVRERFSNALHHLSLIMGRIETRIEKMKAADVDVSVVESLQVNAEVAIDVAEADIADVRTYIENVDESADRAAVKAELSAKIKEARESVRAAREAVRKVVSALVTLAKENRPNASLETDATIE
jgi:hypothetical protein